jgi:hypothetical protein
MTILVANNAVGALASNINDTQLSLVLQGGQGALFPNPTAGQFFYATIITDSNTREIVKVTARATDTLTIVRAQDGTSASAFTAGDRVELRPCKAIHDNYPQLDTENTFTADQNITGELTVTDVTVEDDLTVEDDAFILGDLTVSGAVSVAGTITMSTRKVDAFATGVAMLFRQSSVPTGWTKDTTYNDAALRVVSGTPSQQTTSGNEFTTLFAARTISANNLPEHTHAAGTLSADSNGAHTHTISDPTTQEDNNNSGGNANALRENSGVVSTIVLTTSSNGAHTHTISGNTGNNTTTAEAMNFDVNYVDVYLATKDA